MFRLRKFLFPTAIGFLALLAGPACADNTSAAFLKIPASARAAAMGGGYAAIADDLGAISLNPSGLAGMNAKQLALSYDTPLLGSELASLAYGQPTPYGTFGLSYLAMRTGGIDGRDEDGNPTSDYAVQDSAISLAYARSFFRDAEEGKGQLRLGLNLKYVHSNIAGASASAYALDLGAQLPLATHPLPLVFGIAARNLSPGLKYQDRTEPLPLGLSAGVTAQPTPFLSIGATAARYVQDQKSEIRSGVEFSPFGHFLRLRGDYGVNQTPAGSLPSLSGGLGLQIRNLSIDYAFMPVGELGSRQKIDLTFRFDAAEKRGN